MIGNIIDMLINWQYYHMILLNMIIFWSMLIGKNLLVAMEKSPCKKI